jgi:hypothetical protein
MNVKSCLKVNNGFLYRTVSIKLEGVSVTANGAVGSHRYEDGCCGGLCRQTHLPFYLGWHEEDVGQVLISISSAGGKP